MPARNITSEVPPELMKGSVCPVAGIEFVTTATLTATCTASMEENPAATSEANLSRTESAIRMPRYIIIAVGRN